MKRHHRIFPALLVLILASLACGLYPSGEVETYGRVTCTLVDYDWSKQLNGDAEYICSCPSAPFEETNIDNRYLDQEGPGLESKLCAAPSQSDQPSSSVPLVENFAATEPPVLPTPTNTPLPPPVIGGIAACDFVSKYVNIKM